MLRIVNSAGDEVGIIDDLNCKVQLPKNRRPSSKANKKSKILVDDPEDQNTDTETSVGSETFISDP